MKSTQLTGFSLVELSIVLVILGLLVGGVLGGQNLIRAAEMRAVGSEFQQWQTAIYSFRLKYHALPGDMASATRFWGTHTGCGSQGAGGNDTPGYLGGAAMVGTCNGDGSGRITNNNMGSHDYERFLFWQHLSLAGLINGNYTGVRGPAIRYHHIAGENAPASRLDNAGWTARSRNSGDDTTWMEHDYHNILHLTPFNGSDGLPAGSVLTPEDAWSIDSKLDDGKPGTGSIVAVPFHNGCSNAASNIDYAAEYSLHDNRVLCSLVFIQTF